MKCIVPGANVKVLARAIHALSKIGDEIYVQPQEKSLSFRAVSSSNSAYSDFTFHDTYFSYYNYGDLNEDDVLKCKVPMRGAIAVFKTPSLMDKLIETCHIRLEPNASQLIFILKYKNSVVKTFLLPIIDCEALKASYNKDGLPNILTVQPKVLVEALHNFQQSLVEITLDVKTDTVFMRNYIDETSSSHVTRTQLSLSIGEFDNYTVGENSCVTFCLKELRSILSFAEQVMVPIDITFESAGKPIVFILKNSAFEGNLVLSTLNPIVNDTNDSIMRERRALMKKRGRGIDKRAAGKAKKGSSKISIASTSTTSIVQSILSKDSLADGRTISTTSTRTNVTDKNANKDNDKDKDSLVSSLKSTSIDETKKSNNNSKKTKINEINKTPVIIQESLSPIGTSSSSSSSIITKSRNNNVVPPTISSQNSATSIDMLSGLNRNIAKSTTSSQNSDIPIVTPKIFSLARRSRQSFDADNNNIDNFDDVVPVSPPPAKKAKIIFRKCLQETFDPRFLPGHDELLADDSDDENN
ncbi:hypothetical protein HCN44_009398 [Aphidius gifuensis]|uniref:Cell cycle checkpoint control protein RAD9A n=1 Tax=Aphidius gifuensis TaxID=684658 RepID=A0A835CYU7_APHGI|nr:cell cycle checkpoint control protein RAD9A [Aphidius gifuensis]KAF7998000.1 hypothetical protein HCN44_009398 [Aphidius gifuensis]